MSFTAPKPGKFSIGVLRKSGGDLRFEIGLIPDYDFGPLNVAASSLIVPADHPEAFTVGATSLADVIRPFSSLGPTNDGRIEPDLVAPDGVSTSLGIFFGTSAAAPHAAGAAAILLSLDGSLSVGQVRDRLRSQAVQVAADPVPGPDNVYGSGRLDADFSALATPTPPKKSGGGGCRVVDPADGGALPLLGALALVLLYGAWLRRRG